MWNEVGYVLQSAVYGGDRARVFVAAIDSVSEWFKR